MASTRQIAFYAIEGMNLSGWEIRALPSTGTAFMLQKIARRCLVAFIAAILVFQPIPGFAPAPASAGLLTRAVSAGAVYISANLIRVMFLHASMHAREAAKRKFFEVLVRSPQLLPKATRMVEGFIKSPKIQQKLAGPDGANFMADEVAPVLGRLKAFEKPLVANNKLNNIVNDMFRPGAKIGNGSTADALRHELRTGDPVGGRRHLTKALDYLNGLRGRLNDPLVQHTDKGTAKILAEDLANAIRGK